MIKETRLCKIEIEAIIPKDVDPYMVRIFELALSASIKTFAEKFFAEKEPETGPEPTGLLNTETGKFNDIN